MELLCAQTKNFLPEYIYPIHSHQNIEVIYVIAGNCLLHIGGESIALNMGDSVFISSNISHNFIVGNSNGCVINHLELIPNNSISDKVANYVKLSDCEIVSHLIDTIKKSKALNCNNLSEKLIGSVFNQILDVYTSFKIDLNIKNNMHIVAEKAAKLLQQNFLDELNLEDFASTIGYTSRYIRKIFHQCYGMSPNNYVITLRLEYSKILLAQGIKSVSEIASNCGFNNIQYFSKIFKERIGVLPSDFKKINSQGARYGF